MNLLKKFLKEKKLRLTKQKKEVFCVLKSKKPQTIEEIFKKINLNKKIIDKTTIYRILETFLKLGIVNKVYFNDKKVRFELKNENHHHHLICKKCGRVEDIELSEKKLLKEVAKKTKFEVISHSLEFFGYCQTCQ